MFVDGINWHYQFKPKSHLKFPKHIFVSAHAASFKGNTCVSGCCFTYTHSIYFSSNDGQSDGLLHVSCVHLSSAWSSGSHGSLPVLTARLPVPTARLPVLTRCAVLQSASRSRCVRSAPSSGPSPRSRCWWWAASARRTRRPRESGSTARPATTCSSTSSRSSSDGDTVQTRGRGGAGGAV